MVIVAAIHPAQTRNEAQNHWVLDSRSMNVRNVLRSTGDSGRSSSCSTFLFPALFVAAQLIVYADFLYRRGRVPAC